MDWFEMDDSPLFSVSRPVARVSRRTVWPALTSLLLVTSLASSPAESDPRQSGENLESTDPPIRLVVRLREERGAPATPIGVSLLDMEARHQSPPSIDLANFNERYWGRTDIDTAPESLSFVEQPTNRSVRSDPELPGQEAGNTRTRHDRAVFSPISVFSFELGPVGWAARPAVDPRTAKDGRLTQARPDLLSGVPDDYATLAVQIAAEETVDPNWVLSIMRAENARFNPGLVSSAGAVGLMQVMPKIGDAFGANDLTDPEQNIRAGTRFLRLLIDKYRNPVLIASAYNAGEPGVDAHQSLPLIRETADYVTRVVGYYTGKPATSQPPMPGPASGFQSDQHRRSGPTDRARSPMLVFSAASPLASDSRLPQPLDAAQLSGPVKIAKDEVLQ
ncbi:lytic transglycosylase domain-containing protein [Agrobacterium pusense]|uniref:lytic transglycosylase domain-containing protein n=1 Tax=Agrobacterium pusense TaxID=648995 RepID=UPI003FD2CB63